MSQLYTLFGIWLALLVGCHVMLTWRIVRRLLRPDPALLTDDECPPALVVLCLRGGDPFLHRTLNRLLDQGYPRYRIRIMLDSATDEARGYVEEALGSSPPENVEVRYLENRHATCTYKMSGILAATEELPPGTQIVALLDGDTVLHRTWLRELATPFIREGATVVTGNRWYVPDRATLPNLVRFWWSSSALALMYVLRIPWGGTLAVRAETIQDPELRHRIQHAFSEDTTIGQFANERGGRVSFQRALIINNGEDITLRGLFNFDSRQLIAVKMQHRGWRWLGLHGLVASVWIIFPVLRGWSDFEPWVIFTFRSLLAVLLVQAFLQDWCIRRVLRQRGERLPWWNPWRLFLSLIALLIVPFVHVPAAIRAYFSRRIVWRGVSYRLGGTPPVQVDRDLWAR